jgi:hypothetical protein
MELTANIRLEGLDSDKARVEKDMQRIIPNMQDQQGQFLNGRIHRGTTNQFNCLDTNVPSKRGHVRPPLPCKALDLQIAVTSLHLRFRKYR